MDISSQQGLLKLENRAFLAINRVERESLISKSNKGSSKNLACEQTFGRAGNFPCDLFPQTESLFAGYEKFGIYIRRNLDITNLYITKSSEKRTIFFFIDEVLDFIKLLLIAVYRT